MANYDDIVRFIFRGGKALSDDLATDLARTLRSSIDQGEDALASVRKWADSHADDLSSQAKQLIGSSTFKARVAAIDVLSTAHNDFAKAINSNVDVNVSRYVDQIQESASLSKADLDAVRTDFQRLLDERNAVLDGAVKDGKAASREDALAAWRKAQDDAAPSAGRSTDNAAKGVTRAELDEALGGVRQLSAWQRMRLNLGLVGLVPIAGAGIALADREVGSPLARALGRGANSGVWGLKHLCEFGLYIGPATIDFFNNLTSSPAEFAAQGVIAGLDDAGKIPEGEKGEHYKQLIRLSCHAVSLNVGEITTIATGLDLDYDTVWTAILEARKEAQEQNLGLMEEYELTAKLAAERIEVAMKEKAAANKAEHGDALVTVGANAAKEKIAERFQLNANDPKAGNGNTGNAPSPSTVTTLTEEQRKARELREAAASRTRMLTDQLNSVSFQGIAGDVKNWSNDTVSSAFNLAQDNADKLGMAGFIFSVVGIASGIVGAIFGKNAAIGIQRWAMDMFGVDDKLVALKESAQSGAVASLRGDRFSIGGPGPAPDLALG